MFSIIDVYNGKTRSKRGETKKATNRIKQVEENYKLKSFSTKKTFIIDFQSRIGENF